MLIVWENKKVIVYSEIRNLVVSKLYMKLNAIVGHCFTMQNMNKKCFYQKL